MTVPADQAPIVLVIDDNDTDRAAIADILTSDGFEVHTLSSPIGATRAARQLQAQAVVIDQTLPAMDGNKLATLFRGNSTTRDVRVILISDSEDPNMAEIAKQAEVDAFVSKRELHDRLGPTLKRLLGS